MDNILYVDGRSDVHEGRLFVVGCSGKASCLFADDVCGLIAVRWFLLGEFIFYFQAEREGLLYTTAVVTSVGLNKVLHPTAEGPC